MASIVMSDLLPDLGVELTFAVSTIVLAFIMSQLRRATSKQKLKLNSRADKTSVPHAPLPSTAKRPERRGSAERVARFAEQVICLKIPAAKLLQEYEEMRREQKHIGISQELALAGSTRTAVDFYAALIQCAGRAGRPQTVQDMLADMVEAGIEPPLAVFESAMKLLAGKSCFKEAVNVYQQIEKRGIEPSAASMSCAISFASDIGEHDLAISIFDRLNYHALPSLPACMSILRIYAKRSDWSASTELLFKVHAQGVIVDSLLLNTVLSTGVHAGNVDAAEALLFKEPGASVADVVSFNIILKGLAQSCEMEKTTDLLHKMMESKIQPNLVSLNTVLDATVRVRRTRETWRLYSLMLDELKVKPDKCTCSTLVKTFVINHHESEGRVEMVLDLIDEVRQSCTNQLLQSLLSGCLAASLRLTPSLASLALAKRAFSGLAQNDRMLASSSDLLSLLNAAASLACPPKSQANNDRLTAAAQLLLRFAWRHATDFGSDFADAKRLAEERAERCNGLAAATLVVLAEGQKLLRASKASKKASTVSVATASPQTTQCSTVTTSPPWRRPVRA